MPWDVFISHASEDKAAVAVPLAEALEAAGVSVWLDKQQIRIGDNIPAAVQRGLAGSRCGVVILSPRYFAKPWATAELEALLHRDIGGRQLILPIHHDITAEEIGDRAPLIAPRLGLPWQAGLPVIVPEIIAALSRQVVPENFSASAAPAPTPAPPAQPLALVLTHERATLFVERSRVEVGESVSLTLHPAAGREVAILSTLRRAADAAVAVSFDLQAYLGRITSIRQRIDGGRETWDVEIREDERLYGDRFMQDMGFGDLSADALAELRARRILLNEKATRPGNRPGSDTDPVNDAAFEMFVRGFGVPLEVPESPIPLLYRDLRNDPGFLAAARLVCVLWLRLSGTVSEIHRLDLTLPNDREVHVAFEGTRPRRYSNVDPLLISVDGDCPLE